MGYIDFTEERIAEHIKLGYGQGCGANYKPWIGVGSFSNQGRGSRVFGIKFPRKHDLLSDLETKFYYWLEWNENVIDIREQYPLFPVFETEEIARLLGVEHPSKIGGNNSFVMTTDFFVTVKVGNTTQYIAYSVKYSTDLSARVLEKLSIEKEYWNRRGVNWFLVTEMSIDMNECANIRFFQERFDYPLKITLDESMASEPIEQLRRIIAEGKGILSEVTSELDQMYNLKKGSMLALFRYLVAHRLIPVNLKIKFVPTKQIEELVDVSLLKAMLHSEDEKNDSTS